MEDRETPRMHKYGESKTTRIMTATVRHVTSSPGIRENFRPMDFCSTECTISQNWLMLHDILGDVSNTSLNETIFSSNLAHIFACSKPSNIEPGAH